MGRAGVVMAVAMLAWAAGPVVQATTVLDTSISLAQVRNTGSGFWANDFHVRMKADRQWFTVPTLPTWASLTVGDIRSDGYYCGGLMGVLGPTVTVDGDYIELTWTFLDTWIDSNQTSLFGFTTFGGIRFNDVQWWWTHDGADVRDLPEVWQDWYYEGGVLVDRVRNGTGGPVSLTRTSGSQAATVGIADVANMGGLPPNPVVINPPGSPVVLPGGVEATVNYTWPWPAGDPSYFMFYQFQDGLNEITFTNAANVVPECASTVLALTGLVVGLMRRRRVG